MISSKIFFTGVLLMIIMLVVAKLEANKDIDLSETTRAICGLLVIIAIIMIIGGAFGIIWGI